LDRCPPLLVTVAVNVTAWPKIDGFWLEATLVLVDDASRVRNTSSVPYVICNCLPSVLLKMAPLGSARNTPLTPLAAWMTSNVVLMGKDPGTATLRTALPLPRLAAPVMASLLKLVMPPGPPRMTSYWEPALKVSSPLTKMVPGLLPGASTAISPGAPGPAVTGPWSRCR